MYWNKLSQDFYLNKNVVQTAKNLIGKVLFTQFNNILTGGIIIETEAYNGIIDKASHAYNNKRTNRTEIMYAGGGVAYVYLCYGIHHLFNVVTNVQDTPHAVLIRGIKIFAGEDMILKRSCKPSFKNNIILGPGKISKALGITTMHTGISLLQNEIFIADANIKVTVHEIMATPRIGVEYAQEDALLPYRFVWNPDKGF